eukprot:scaffold4203_cov295-Prasinococcus_capsulatus_cf.AAC.1
MRPATRRSRRQAAAAGAAPEAAALAHEDAAHGGLAERVVDERLDLLRRGQRHLVVRRAVRRCRRRCCGRREACALAPRWRCRTRRRRRDPAAPHRHRAAARVGARRGAEGARARRRRHRCDGAGQQRRPRRRATGAGEASQTRLLAARTSGRGATATGASYLVLRDSRTCGTAALPPLPLPRTHAAGPRPPQRARACARSAERSAGRRAPLARGGRPAASV